MRINRTVYVDAKYGSKNGKLGSPNCPFSKINEELDTIKDIQKSVTNPYIVQISPVEYFENLSLKDQNVVVQGRGKYATFFI